MPLMSDLWCEHWFLLSLWLSHDCSNGFMFQLELSSDVKQFLIEDLLFLSSPKSTMQKTTSEYFYFLNKWNIHSFVINFPQFWVWRLAWYFFLQRVVTPWTFWFDNWVCSSGEFVCLPLWILEKPMRIDCLRTF